MRLSLALFFALVSFAQEGGGERWKLQYFYDVDKSTFEIADLRFPSATRGIAVGALVAENSVKPMSAVTSDGGVHWTPRPHTAGGVGASCRFAPSCNQTAWPQIRATGR